jgi:hypothetical protein
MLLEEARLVWTSSVSSVMIDKMNMKLGSKFLK